MLAKRIIACLDVRDGRVVKGQKFIEPVDVADPAALGKAYSAMGIDELVFYDITASAERRKTSLEFVERVADEINIPFCVGGGVNSLEDFKEILRKGADKVSVNSGAIKNPQLIAEASQAYGAQCVVLSIDCKSNGDGTWSVYAKGGREKTDLDALSWAVEGVRLGAGELVLNSIDEDGMKNGFDTALLKEVIAAVNVPVIASGGAGTMAHFLEAANVNADGLLAASVFHFGEIDVKDLKQYLKENGVAVRL